MRNKYKYYRIEKAAAYDEFGNFIPAENLKWIPIISRFFHESIYPTFDEANITRIDMQKNDNSHYYRVYGIRREYFD